MPVSGSSDSCACPMPTTPATGVHSRCSTGGGIAARAITRTGASAGLSRHPSTPGRFEPLPAEISVDASGRRHRSGFID